jgi:hypothetical protein
MSYSKTGISMAGYHAIGGAADTQNCNLILPKQAATNNTVKYVPEGQAFKLSSVLAGGKMLESQLTFENEQFTTPADVPNDWFGAMVAGTKVPYVSVYPAYSSKGDFYVFLVNRSPDKNAVVDLNLSKITALGDYKDYTVTTLKAKDFTDKEFSEETTAVTNSLSVTPSLPPISITRIKISNSATASSNVSKGAVQKFTVESKDTANNLEKEFTVYANKSYYVSTDKPQQIQFIINADSPRYDKDYGVRFLKPISEDFFLLKGKKQISYFISDLSKSDKTYFGWQAILKGQKTPYTNNQIGFNVSMVDYGETANAYIFKFRVKLNETSSLVNKDLNIYTYSEGATQKKQVSRITEAKRVTCDTCSGYTFDFVGTVNFSKKQDQTISISAQ